MKKILIEKYETSAALLTALANKKVNPANTTNGETESHNVRSWYTKWAQTANYEEAESLMKFGYRKGLDGIRNEQIKLQRKNATTAQKAHIIQDFAGFAPHVPNYLAGLPFTMINKTKTPKEIRVVRLYIDCTADNTKDEQFFYAAGANILTIIQALERLQINTEIIAVAPYGIRHKKNGPIDTKAILQFKIKSAGERLNAIRLSFPLCHPSFVRRIYFDWLEKLPFNIDLKSYGKPLQLNELNAALNLSANEILVNPYLAQNYDSLCRMIKAINTL